MEDKFDATNVAVYFEMQMSLKRSLLDGLGPEHRL
jgi:hypothetical protein